MSSARERIDHGVRCLEDRSLVQRLGADRIPLTVCPFSNVKLRVVDTLDQHPLAKMLEHGLCATVNSDDPAYFGGYVGANLAGVAKALRLDDDTIVELARDGFEASFLDDAARALRLAELDAARWTGFHLCRSPGVMRAHDFFAAPGRRTGCRARFAMPTRRLAGS